MTTSPAMYQFEVGGQKIEIPLADNTRAGLEGVSAFFEGVKNVTHNIGDAIEGVNTALDPKTGGLTINPTLKVDTLVVNLPFGELVHRNAPYITIAVALVVVFLIIIRR